MSRSIVWGIAAILTASVAAGQQPKNGAPAPSLGVELLQAPREAKATWDSLKGKAAVLNFWSTWCTGCVAEIPPLNAMAEKFKDRPVRFLFITDEDRETVSRFLAERPIAGWVALDTSGATFRAFGVEGRPLTAFVDANGLLRGETNLNVDESDVEKLVAGTLQMAQPEEKEVPTIGAETTAPQPLLHVLIRPALAETESGMSPGSTRLRGNLWEAWGLDLKRILSYSFSTSLPRIAVPVSYADARYDIAIILPDGSEDSRKKMLQQTVESAFHVKPQIARRETDAFVLRRLATSNLGFKEDMKGRSLNTIVTLAEQLLRRPVIDETGLDRKYAFVLAFPDAPASLTESLHTLGLSLLPERRPIDVLVAEPIAAVQSVRTP